MTPDRSTSRRGTMLRLVARIALVVVVVGVPIWLAGQGGTTVLHLDPRLLWRAAADARSDDTRAVISWLGRVALAVAWVAWAWTVVCLFVELHGWASGRTPRRLPASRTLQWMAACLVGTAFALGGVGRAPAHAHPVGIYATRQTRTAPTTEWIRGAMSEMPPDASTPPGVWTPRSAGLVMASGRTPVERPLVVLGRGASEVPAPARTHTVTARETLWSVAELRLGSALRWASVAELNYGRVQFDGASLGRDHWIRPGWTLELPAEAPGVALELPSARTTWIGGDEITRAAQPAQPAQPAPVAPVAPVAPIGAGVVGVGMSDLVDRMRKVQQRHRRAGSRIRLPEPLLRQFEQRLRVATAAEAVRGVEEAVLRFHEHIDPTTPHPRIIGVTVSDEEVRLVLAPGTDGFAVPPGFSRVDGGPVAAISRDELSRTRALRTGRARNTFPLPTLVTVGCSDDRLVMVHPEGLGSIAVEGDRHDAEGLARALSLELATSRWADRFDLVLVGFGADLARLGRVTVVDGVGPLVADLSWRALRAGVALQDAGHASLVAARCRAAAARSSGDPAGLRGAAGRSGSPGTELGSWDPVVVICGPDVSPEATLALTGIAGDGSRGIAVVMIGPRAVEGSIAAHVVRAHGAAPGAALEVFGEFVEAQQVGQDELSDACALLVVADTVDRSPGEDCGPGPGDDYCASEGAAAFDHHPAAATARVGDARPDVGDGGDHLGDPASQRDDRAFDASQGSGRSAALGTRPDETLGARPASGCVHSAEPGAPVHLHEGTPSATRPPGGSGPGMEVEVSVLGPVEIHGAARSFTRAWSRELVVYLSLHPRGASNDSWATALWPDRVMAPSSLHSTASVARRALGKARDGTDHLPRGHGRLELAASVGTDWDRFQGLSSGEDPRGWEEALSLVRGRPLDGLRSTDWSILDGTLPTMESTIVDVSGRLSGACLRTGDASGAEWAARRGLRVSPYDERLYRMLLRAADVAGNPSGVESVMAELVRVVADEIEPIESVHPSTLMLYRTLSRRKIASM